MATILSGCREDLSCHVRDQEPAWGAVAVKVHAEHLRLAKVEEWEIPTNGSRKPYRRAAYVVPPQESSEESSSSESEGGDTLPKIARWYRRERDNSSEEENIPLAELAGRLKARERRLEREQGPVDRHKTSDDETSAVSDEAMSVDEVRTWERLR